MQSGMQSEQARRWEAALDRARDDDWIHYATVSGWLASCLRRRQWARFALCGGVLMVLMHLARSAAHVKHLPQASDDGPDADDHDDIVDARGAQVLPSSSPPPATATKTVWATRRPLAGNDYHCEDSDGMGTDAWRQNGTERGTPLCMQRIKRPGMGTGTGTGTRTGTAHKDRPGPQPRESRSLPLALTHTHTSPHALLCSAYT